MRSPLFSIPLVLLGTTIACDGGGETDKEGEDTDSGVVDSQSPDTDTFTESCSADLTLTFPDGSTVTLDYCQASTMEAEFEFDPDEAPEIRAPTLIFHAVTDSSFECWVEIAEPAVCGEGLYRMDGSSGSVTFDTHDCSGVGDDYEALYVASTGFLNMETLHAGDEAGNFSGQPLATTMAGSLSYSTEDGVQLSGSFSLLNQALELELVGFSFGSVMVSMCLAM